MNPKVPELPIPQRHASNEARKSGCTPSIRAFSSSVSLWVDELEQPTTKEVTIVIIQANLMSISSGTTNVLGDPTAAKNL